MFRESVMEHVMKDTIVARSIHTEDFLQLELDHGVIVGLEVLGSIPDEKILRLQEKSGVPYIAPGFFDIQVNGYAGKDYSDQLSTEDMEQMVMRLAESGTTRHMPTIITNSELSIIESIRAIVDSRKESTLLHNAIVGLHIEGPFISPKEGACGVHDPKHIRPCDFDEFQRWQESAEGLIRLVTVSPEDDTALEFIRKVTALGVRVAIGHIVVPPDQIEKAVDAGATLSTHLGNGSPGFLPRLNNFIWKELSDDRLYASIIADGFHLPPYVLDAYTRSKGRCLTILISDAAALAGSPPGVYRWGDMDIEVFPDGHMGLLGTTNLAGASLLLDRCIAHLHEVTKFSLSECVSCATRIPHDYLRLEGSVWKDLPKVGSNADFTLFNYQRGDGNLRVLRTQLGREVLFKNM